MSYENSNSGSEHGDSLSDSDPKPGTTNGRSGGSGVSPASGTPAISPTAPGIHRCSHCGDIFERSESKNMPFCSRRCQEIDLGMWLNESYGFPTESDSTADNFGIPVDDDDA